MLNGRCSLTDARCGAANAVYARNTLRPSPPCAIGNTNRFCRRCYADVPHAADATYQAALETPDAEGPFRAYGLAASGVERCFVADAAPTTMIARVAAEQKTAACGTGLGATAFGRACW